MSTLTVALDLPRALDVPRAQLESRLRELIGEGRISSGKGAELLADSPPSIPPKGREVYSPPPPKGGKCIVLPPLGGVSGGLNDY